MSLIGLLSIARSALLAQQRAMSVTAHNVANAQTPGYSRQRLDLAAAEPLRLPFGMLGRGVTSPGLGRARDTLLDLALRTDSGGLGHAQTRLDLLGGVENALLEPSDQGVATAFDELVQAFGDLANEPASGALREIVRGAGRRFVGEVHRVNDALAAGAAEARTRLADQVQEVNRLAAELAGLNQAIAAAGGEGTPDLADRRDLLLDRLAAFGTVRVLAQSGGSVNVVLGNHTQVEGARANDLAAMSLAGGGWAVGSAASGTAVGTGPGSLAALTELLSTTLPGMQSQLDQYVAFVAGEFNAIHAAGYTLTGGTAVNFFSLPSPSAGQLALDAAILASGDNIAAGATAAPGDGNNALALAALAGQPIAGLGGRTLRQTYETFAATVGRAAQDADRDVSVRQALVERDETRRQAVSGVSVDEEMVTLIGQQQAYAAAARLVKAADELMRELINLV
jgi:flagellar hook-associated protein 1 FlgK